MLYIVATPIGNLDDITLRALKVLNDVDFIACEDTRRTLKLLSHFKIYKKLISYHKFNERSSAEKIVKHLENGKSLALVSDSGTPLISDPGYILIKLLKEKNISYTVVPGANAVLSALILSGFDTRNFAFIGFLPENNSERKRLLEKISRYDMSLIFYVSVHSYEKDINEIEKYFLNRSACIIREITKVHESVYHFKIGQKPEIIAKGEIVLVVDGNYETENSLNSLDLKSHLDYYITLGLTKNEAIKNVAHDRKLPKNEVYKNFIEK